MSLRREHGTYAMYAREGCRCDACKEYQRARVARARAARTVFNHGTRSAYDAGCRCDPCRTARREAYLTLPSEYPAVRPEPAMQRPCECGGVIQRRVPAGRWPKRCETCRKATRYLRPSASRRRSAAIRQWARERGLMHSAYGRIPSAVVAAYDAERAASQAGIRARAAERVLAGAAR